MADRTQSFNESGGIMTNQIVSGSVDGHNKVFSVPFGFISHSMIILAGKTYLEDVDYEVEGRDITYKVAPSKDDANKPHILICSL